MEKFKKILKYFLLIFPTLILILAAFFYFRSEPNFEPEWGANFSHTHAQYLGTDWRNAYIATLDELKVKYLRLMLYWSQVEPSQGKFSFADYEWMLKEAEKRQAKVILVVGKKQPRWPECHVPGWANNLSEAEQRKALLEYIEKSVNHFKMNPAVEIWQVENEPIFDFGPDCPKISRGELKEEVEKVKQLDSSRPTLVTDSGEIGWWLPTALSGADYFGSTMYRIVHNPSFGHYNYHLPSAYFRVKSGILKTVKRPEKLFGVELQGEPWFATDAFRTELDAQRELMDAKQLRDNYEYARKSGFERHYWWGTEWWYWMKEKKADPSLWETAQDLFSL